MLSPMMNMFLLGLTRNRKCMQIHAGIEIMYVCIYVDVLVLIVNHAVVRNVLL